MGNLRCPIRKKEVAATPEERVRASFLNYLLEKGFPGHLILVEVLLSDLPHLTAPQETGRRIDIFCYQKNLEPLLLVECKQSHSPKDLGQLLGYNHTLKAPFIALVSKDALQLLDATGKPLPFDTFPTYEELLQDRNNRAFPSASF